MFKESWLDKILYQVKKMIPGSVFDFFAPAYHWLLAQIAALIYGFPSRSMKVIGVTGTKGKSTTVFMITKILEGTGRKVAAIGSLGYKIGDQEWPNTLKMSMPGRFKLQKFLYQARRAGCEFVVLEVTSEGIKQKRHLGIRFDTVVFTNLHREHIEAHGSFENYYQAKQELFKIPGVTQVLNADDVHLPLFNLFPAPRKITFGIEQGDIQGRIIHVDAQEARFAVEGNEITLKLGGVFNIYNALAALAVASVYKIGLAQTKMILEQIDHLPGRMEFIQRDPFCVVVDYAHTPDSLEAVYKTLRQDVENRGLGRLICVLGAAGGGRDKWKRPLFGQLAETYCHKIILTDEDPWEENPQSIVEEIKNGLTKNQDAVTVILDRRQALVYALHEAKKGDTVVVTGKGSETSMALAGGKKIPWSDAGVIREILEEGR